MPTASVNITPYLEQLRLPAPESHKGQNGKLLIIGGSELFHAASKWSLDIASKFVDMVFYSSVPINNQLVSQSKGEFWNGIVVEREDVESYLQEADAILIGPGMTRTPETVEITEYLVSTYPDKKWVIDAGALQMISPKYLNERCIVTPHQHELDMVLEKISGDLSQLLNTGVTVVLKGHVDQIYTGDKEITIEGGNGGMSKGGTGDVLAGLIAGLYCTHEAEVAAVLGSYTNKLAGEHLAQTVGPFFNASDLVAAIPQALWSAHKTQNSQRITS